MGKSLSQTLGVKDPLDDAIHGWIKPGPQQNNYQAPPWWGPVTPKGMPAGGAAAPPSAPAGLPHYVSPQGAPAPLPGFAPPPLVDGRVPRGAAPMAPPPAAAPAANPPAALAQGLAAMPGARTFVNGKPVTAAVEQQAAFGGMPHG